MQSNREKLEVIEYTANTVINQFSTQHRDSLLFEIMTEFMGVLRNKYDEVVQAIEHPGDEVEFLMQQSNMCLAQKVGILFGIDYERRTEIAALREEVYRIVNILVDKLKASDDETGRIPCIKGNPEIMELYASLDEKKAALKELGETFP